MSPVYLASGGVVCHTGRGLPALHKGLLAPVVRPHCTTLTEITPAVTIPWLPAAWPGREQRVMALTAAAVAGALAGYSPVQSRGDGLYLAISDDDLIIR